MSYIRHTMDYQGKLFDVGVTPTVLNSMWGAVGDEAEQEVLSKLGRAIIANHDYSKPLQAEYLYDSDHAELSVDKMIDWIQRNRP